MSDRHQELLRQRALVQDHLAWLDREIAAAASAAAAAGSSPTSPATRYALKSASAASAPPSAASTASSSGYLAAQAAAIAHHAAVAPAPSASPLPSSDLNPAAAATADAIIDEYRVPTDTLKVDVRKGCLLYFFAALVVVGAGVTILYFLFSRSK